MRAVGYTRVSTEEQARQSISLATQKSRLEAYAPLRGLELAEIISDEDSSGKDLQRDGIQRVIHMAKAGEVEAVVVYKLDRLGRKIADVLSVIETFKENSVYFHAIVEKVDTQSKQGQFFFAIANAFAEMERDPVMATASRPVMKKPVRNPLSKRTVLVVEDVKLMRMSLRQILVAEGYDVLEAENGVEALDTLKSSEIDLVITDVKMPNMDGLEMVQQIRANDETATIPVIMCTVSKDKADESRATQLGVQAFLNKPVWPAIVRTKVSEVLDGTNGALS